MLTVKCSSVSKGLCLWSTHVIPSYTESTNFMIIYVYYVRILVLGCFVGYMKSPKGYNTIVASEASFLVCSMA